MKTRLAQATAKHKLRVKRQTSILGNLNFNIIGSKLFNEFKSTNEKKIFKDNLNSNAPKIDTSIIKTQLLANNSIDDNVLNLKHNEN